MSTLNLIEANPAHISLSWKQVSDAVDYKLYWDKGSQGAKGEYVALANRTKGAVEFEVRKENSGGILGSSQLTEQGGTFRFKVSYFDSQGRESQMSEPLQVQVKPKVQVKAPVPVQANG